MKHIWSVLIFLLTACGGETSRELADYRKVEDCPTPMVRAQFSSTPNLEFTNEWNSLFQASIQCPRETIYISGLTSVGKNFLTIRRNTGEFTLHEVELDSYGYGILNIIGLNDEGLYYSVFEPNLFLEIIFGPPLPTLYHFDWRTGTITKAAGRLQ